MTRIVFVSPYGHNGAPSGARRRAEALCHALVAGGKDVVCMSPWTPPDCVRHIPFSLDGSLRRRARNLLTLMFALNSIAPDLVVSESPLCPISFGRFRVLHMIHDSKFTSVYARRGAFLTQVSHWLSARFADKVVTVSYAERKRINTQLGISLSRVAVSYNGLSEQWILTPLPPTNSRRPFDILYVSNFAPHKGHLGLLRAITGLKLKIALVGVDFGELDICKRYAKEHGIEITFFSKVPESELIKIYDKSRIFVFPSYYEGFGMPFLEARARGLPVVANCIPVFQELQSMVGGCIVDFDDHEQVVLAITSLLAADAVPLILPESLSDFCWGSISEALLQLT